ncbi:MAG TPA: hypothetical protein VIG99_08000 [Myxococcaceae bacterium]|jgi:hypothetical protein
MPIQIAGFRLPSGAEGVRGDWTGVVAKEDAEAWGQQVLPGGRFHGLPILAVGLGVDRLTAEARSVFVQLGTDTTRTRNWMAVVIINPVIRVTANFILRIYKTKKMRLFASEEDAVRWLDERVREDAARLPETRQPVAPG